MLMPFTGHFGDLLKQNVLPGVNLFGSRPRRLFSQQKYWNMEGFREEDAPDGFLELGNQVFYIWKRVLDGSGRPLGATMAPPPKPLLTAGRAHIERLPH